jgi:sec-independent protein translocase protein TatB
VLNLDPAKLLVIGVLALVLLGPERLPRVARQLGGAWRELTRLRDQVTDEVKAAFPLDDLPRVPNASSAISKAVSTVTSPLAASLAPNREPRPDAAGEDGAEPTTAAGEPSGDGTSADEVPRRRTAVRRAPEVVVHGALGEFAFVPDDPSMN